MAEAGGGLLLDLLPHEGRIFLDDAAAGQVITDSLTLKRQPAPEGGPFALVYDEDGFAALIGSGEEPVLVEDWLEQKAYKSATGEIFIIQMDDECGKSKMSKWSLTAKLREFSSHKVLLRNAGVDYDFRAFKLSWPRGACRYVWNILDFYHKLGLSCYKKVPSKWCYNMMSSWSDLLASFGFAGHFLLSYNNTGREESLTSTERFLPAPSMTTVAVFVLLGRWAYAAPASHGLRDDDARSKADLLLKALCLSVCVAPFELVIILDLQWKETWPRPSKFGVPQLRLMVSVGGMVDVAEWQRGANAVNDFIDQAETVKAKWFRCIEDDISADGMVSLVRLVCSQKVANNAGFKPLWAQLAAQVAMRAELIFDKSQRMDNCEWDLQLNDMEDDSNWSSREVDKCCAALVKASRLACAGAKCFSIGVDKADIRGLQLQNGLMVLPDNQGFELVPQVVSHIPDQLAGDDEDGSSMEQAVEMGKRQEGLLKRKNAKDTSFRPRKKHRTGAEKVLKMIDNQVRVSAGVEGLKHFQITAEMRQNMSWQDWPHLTVVADQGGDMTSAVHALSHFEKTQINILPVWDPAHGSNRDWWGAVSETDLGNFAHLMMIVLNLNHGPDDSGLRYNQIGDCMNQVYAKGVPAVMPLFQKYARQMAEELGNPGQRDGESADDAVWRSLRELTEANRNKGYKVNKSRFHAVACEGLALARTWHCRLFEVAVCCIELSMLKTAAMPKIRLANTGADEDSNDRTTSNRKPSVGDRTLRNCGANAMVISFAMLCDTSHQRTFSLMCNLAQPTVQWHATASRELRSVQGSLEWMLRQARGDAETMALQTLAKLTSEDMLREAGFLTVNSAAYFDWEDSEIAWEDEYAHIAGSFALSMVKMRLRRTLYMVQGLPHKLALILGTDAERTNILKEFKEQAEDFEHLKNMEEHTAIMRVYLERSPFMMVSTQQVLEACKETDYSPSEELLALMKDRSRCLLQTQAVEDINNHQKNARQIKNWGSRYRRPQTCLATTCRSFVLSSVHKFAVVPWEEKLNEPLEPLTGKDLSALSKPSLPVGEVATYKDKAPYFSPVAADIGIAVADSAMLKKVRPHKRYSELSSAWKGFICNNLHKVALRRKTGGRSQIEGEWLVGLHHFKDSACMCLKVLVKKSPGPQSQYFYIEWPKEQALEMTCITDFDSWECFRFSWRSWAWQVHHVRGVMLAMGPGIRAYKDGAVGSILKVSAECAWFNLPRSTLETICEHEAVATSHCPNTFSVLWRLTKQVLGKGDDETMNVLQAKFTLYENRRRCDAEILAVDEAAQCLREDDRMEIQNLQRRTKEEAIETEDFRTRFREKKAQLRSEAASSSNGRGRGKASINYRGPKTIGGIETITQVKAKTLLPPQSYLWRARGSGSWQARYKDLPVKSCRDHAWGSEARALLECVRHAWRDYLDCNGFLKSDCPIANLWKDEAISEVEALSLVD